MHWLHRHRLLILSLIAIFWTSLVGLAHFFPNAPFLSGLWRGERSFADLLRRDGRKTADHPEFIFLGIDQQSIQLDAVGPEEAAGNRALELMMQKPYPWSREVWALLLDKLFGAGARLVIFDIVYGASSDGDEAFRAALDKYRDRVVLGCNIDIRDDQEGGHRQQLVLPNGNLIPPPQESDDRVGFVNFWRDLDGLVRHVQFQKGPPEIETEAVFQSLAARALNKLGRADAVPNDLNVHAIRFSSAAAYAPRSLYEVFLPVAWHRNYKDGAVFKDKVVIIGASAGILHDVVPTPVDENMYGPVLQLQSLAAALDGEFLHEFKTNTDFYFIIVAALLAWSIVAFVRRPSARILVLVIVAGAYVVLARVLYDRAGLLIFVIPPLIVFTAAGVFGLGFEYVLERLEKLRTRRTLERYVSKNLVREILDNPGGYYSSLLGARKPVTVLFSDLIGFTTLVEKSDPTVLVPRLNRYLSAMVPQVFDNGGTLDKFIGDAIMAVWGNVSSHGAEKDAKAAVQAALGMRKVMAKLNEQWRAEGIDPLAFGIGINHGEAVVGNIGSYEPHERLDPTVIGDAVNLASRLEALTRQYQVDILVGSSARELVRDEFLFRSVDVIQVKGKTKPVEVFALVGARNDQLDPDFLKWLKSYEEGVVNFRGRKFSEAKILFSQFLEFYPDDYLAKMYLERALRYEKAPPDASWNAVEVFTKK
ncbi:MAG TPA: adenylate/guanylate cyclase domain-containing protein [Chthoniobacterales bacterium]|nr:adenylate/guanylate cyclase domain-containing protein [Chthoniobacterales bacterium]